MMRYRSLLPDYALFTVVRMLRPETHLPHPAELASRSALQVHAPASTPEAPCRALVAPALTPCPYTGYVLCDPNEQGTTGGCN